jgi:hypothetical protein
MGSRQIFLSYAREDITTVRALYARLKSDGFRIWLDLEDVLPGQLWESAIQGAIQNSRTCVIALSPNAITKTGYIQKEVRTALEMTELMPEGRVFIIPLRLVPCDVPARLKRWQWVDLFDDDGYERLKRSLRKQLVSPKPRPASAESLLETPTSPDQSAYRQEPIRIKRAHNDGLHANKVETQKAAIRRPRLARKATAETVIPEPAEREIIASPRPAELSPRETSSQTSSASRQTHYDLEAAGPKITAGVNDGPLQAILKDTAWRIGCRKCREKSRWIRLRADGLVEFRFGNDRDYRFEGDDSWRVESNELIISWRAGFSVERFTFIDPTQTTALGTSSNVRGPLRITRLQ